MNEQWLIWSNEHKAWWRPNSNGYTRDHNDAGKYDKEEAATICRDANRHLGHDDPPNETMLPA